MRVSQHKAEKIRSFLALSVDPQSIDFLGQAVDRQMRHYPGFRPVPSQDWHLTLHFLGYQPRETLENLVEEIDMIAGTLPSPGGFFLARLGLFPHPTRGNMVVAEGPSTPAMAAWHRTLAVCLETLSIPIESRTWRPHITLARKPARQANEPLAAAELSLEWTVRIDAVNLMESRPSEPTHRYHPLKTWRL